MSAAVEQRPAAPVTTPHLDRVLRTVRRRMRLNRVLAVAGPAALAAAAIVLAWVAVSRWVPVPRPGPVALAGLAVGATAMAATGAVVRIGDQWAAWAADRWLGQPEVFATALQLRDTADTSDLAAEHLRRAERLAAASDGLPDPPRLPGRMFAAAVVIALAASGLAVSGDPQRGARERAAAERAATAAQADSLRTAADALARDGEPARRQEAERLRELADELDGTDLETALEQLQNAREELAGRSGGDLAAQRTALAGLERSLEAAPLTPGAADRSATEQLDQLAGDLDAGRLGAEQREQLAERLDQLADALGGQPEVAGALGEAAQSLRDGGPGAAGAVEAAAGAVSQAEQRLAAGEAAAEAAGAVDAAAEALRDQRRTAGDQSAQGEQGAQGGQNGGGNEPGQGNHDGQGSQNGGNSQNSQGNQGGQGSRGGQGGQGATASGQPRDGRAGPSGQAGQEPTRDRPSGDLDTQTVYDPDRPRGASGEDLQIQGQDSGDAPETTRGSALGEGRHNPALIPYQDVLAEYRQRATRTVERPGYPVRLRDTVRDYFDGLASPGG